MFLFILYGGMLALTISIGYLVRSTSKAKLLSFFLYLDLGFLQIHHGLLCSPLIEKISWVFFWDIPFILLIAPLTYFSFLSWIQDNFNFKKRYYLHFLPGWIVFLILLPVSFKTIDSKLNLFDDFLFQPISSLKSLYFIAILILFFYLWLIYHKYPQIIFLFRQKGVRKVIGFILGFLFLIFLTLAIGIILGNLLVINIGNALVSGLILFLYFSDQRYPHLSEALRVDIKNSYQISQLRNLDISQIITKLDQIMKQEKLFQDENLSLKQLAQALEITPHQLSELLNSNLKMSFKQFINNYRVNEAKIRLIEAYDQTVLSIGLSVGFNSNSAFYTAFKGVTGKSPHQYRLDEPKS